MKRWPGTEEDIRQLKDEIDKLFEKMSERMDKLDSRCFDIEKGIDSMKEEIDAEKKENANVRGQLRQPQAVQRPEKTGEISHITS